MTISLQIKPETTGFEYIAKDTAHPTAELHFHLPQQNTAVTKIVNEISANIFSAIKDQTAVVHITLTAQEIEEASKDGWIKQRCEKILSQALPATSATAASTATTASTASTATATSSKEASAAVAPPATSLQDIEKMAAMLCGDLFIQSTTYEGYSRIGVMNYVKSWLEKKIKTLKEKNELEKVPKFEQLLEGLKKGIEADRWIPMGNAAESHFDIMLGAFISQIKTLKSGEKTIIGGGWTDNQGGHAVYYEVMRREDGNFRLRIFNKGAGVEYSPGIQVFNPEASERDPKLETRYLGHRTIDEISKERMESKAAWRAALEILTYTNIPQNKERSTESDPKTEYSEKDLEKLFSIFGGKVVVPQNLTPDDYTTTQHSGICPWASLEEVIKTYLPSNEATRMSYEMSKQALQDLLQAYSAYLQMDQARGMLNKAAMHFVTKSKQLLESGIISIDELEADNALASKIKRLVETAEKNIEKERDQKATAEKIKIEAMQQKSYGSLPYILKSGIDTLTMAQPGGDYTEMVWNPAWKPDPKTLAKDLQKFCEIVESVDIHEHPIQSRVLFVRDLMMSLPMAYRKEDPFWSQVEDIDSCTTSIALLGKLLMTFCEEFHLDAQPEQRMDYIVCMYKGLIIQHKLASRCKELQGELRIDHWVLDPPKEGFLSCFANAHIYDGELSRQMIQISNYLSQQTSEREWFFGDPQGENYESGLKADTRDTPVSNESQMAYVYYCNNKERFRKCYSKKFATLSTYESRRRGNKNLDQSCATFSMQDLSGDYFPVPYYKLKEQALRANFFLRGVQFEPPIYYYGSFGVEIKNPKKRTDITAPKLVGTEWVYANDYRVNKAFQQIGEPVEKENIDRGKVTPLEWTELRSVSTSISTEGDPLPKELQVIKAVDGFEADSLNDTIALHFERLRDHDFKSLFRDFLFNRDYFSKCLQKNPEFAKRFLEFTKRGFEYFQERNQVVDATYMIYLAQMCKERLMHLASEKDVKYNHEFFLKSFDTGKSLKDLLSITKSISEKAVVYRQLIFEYDSQWESVLKNKMSEKNFYDLLTALVFVESSSVNHEHPNGHLSYAVNRMKHRTRPHIADALNSRPKSTLIAKFETGNSAFVKSLAEAMQIEPKILLSLTWSVGEPWFTGSIEKGYEHGCIFNFETFSFFYGARKVTTLPSDIVEHADFKRNFPHITQIFANSDGKGKYEFMDGECGVRISKSGTTLRITRQFTKNGPWYDHFTDANVINKIFSSHLQHEKTHWIASEGSGEILFCTPGANQITHKIIPKADREFDIIDVRYPERVLANISTLPESIRNSFLRFEPAEQMLVWLDAKSGEPVSIEMPRIPLSFDIESTKEGLRAKSKQITGFYLSEKQRINALGAFSNYLVLENEKGQKKVIFPFKDILAAHKGSLSSGISLSYYFSNVKSKFPPFFEYTVNDKGELETPYESGNLFLAHLFLAQRRYEKAYSYLKKSKKLKLYSEREIYLLRKIRNHIEMVGDNDPKALALFLCSVALMNKNRTIFAKTPFPKIPGAIYSHEPFKKNYLAYLSSLDYVGENLLTPDIELFVVTMLAFWIPDDEFIKDRYRILTEAAKSALGITTRPISPKIENDEIAEKTIQDALALDTMQAVSLTTRPGKAQQNLETFLKEKYALAKNAKPDERMDLAITFALQAKFQNQKGLFAFLTAVALKPDKFPDLNVIISNRKEKNPSAAHLEMCKQAALIYHEFIGTEQQKKEADIKVDLSKMQTDTKASVSAMQADIKEEVAKVDKEIMSLPREAEYVQDVFKNLFVPMPSTEERKKVALQLKREMEQKSLGVISGTGEKIQKDIVTDIDAFANQPKVPEFRFSSENDRDVLLSDLEISSQLIDARRIISSEKTEQLKTAILDIANRKTPYSSQTREQAAKYVSALESSQQRPLTIEMLAILFLRNNNALIKKQNPLLTDNDITNIRAMMTTYLIRVTNEQKLLRQTIALNEISKHVKEHPKRQNFENDFVFKDLTQKAAQEFTSTRAYDPDKEIHFAVYEFFSEKMLRDDQVQNIRKLVNTEFMILQMIMGAGKSAVLLPIIAMLYADGEFLSVVVLTDSLYESTMKDLRNGVWKNFERIVHTRQIERSTPMPLRRLDDLLQDFEAMRRNGEPLVMKSKSLACLLILRFVETLYDFNANRTSAELREAVKIYQKIVKLFKTKSRAIFDEPDQSLSAKLEVNFTRGVATSMNVGRNIDRRNLITAIYMQLNSSEMQKEFGDLIKSFTMQPEEFSKTVKPALIKRMMSVDPLSKHLKELNLDQKKIEAYLQGTKSDELEDYVESIQNETCKDLLALLREELNTMLPSTLSKRFCVDYGSAKRKMKEGQQLLNAIAIPYSGNNTPLKLSEFRSPDVIMNNTIQNCWIGGLDVEDIQIIVQKIAGEATKTKDYHNCAAYKVFKEICGEMPNFQKINLLALTTEDFANITSYLNDCREKNPQKFFNFINEYILSAIAEFTGQIPSTAIELTGLFKSIIGFTGTPWNNVTLREVLNKGTVRTAGTDGKSAVVLADKTDRPDGIRTLKTDRYPDLLAELIRKEDDALIDTGAVFNGHSNKEVAEKILEQLHKMGSPKKGVIYFRENLPVVLEIVKSTPKGIETQTVPLAESALKPEERYVYYDQPKTTGTDIPLPITSHATLTVGKDDKTRDKFQGAWRERSLDKQQGISLVMTPEADKKMRMMLGLKPTEQIRYHHVLQFTNANQERQLLSHVAMAIQQKIDFVLRMNITDKILNLDFSNPKLDEENFAFLEDVQQFFIRQQSPNPYELYGKKQISATDISGLKNQIKKSLEALKPSSPLFGGNQKGFIDHLMKQMDEELGDIAKLLPNVPIESLGLGRNEGEVENQQQQEAQAQSDVNIDQMLSSMKYNPTNLQHIKKSWNNTEQLFSRELYSADRQKSFDEKIPKVHAVGMAMPKFAALSKDLLASENRLAPTEKGKSDLCLHTNLQLPFQYYLFVRDKKTQAVEMMLLDTTSDLNYFWEALSADRQGKYVFKGGREVELCICNPNGKVIQHGSEMSDGFEKFISSQSAEMIVRAKLLCGQLTFAEEEKEHVLKLIKEHGGLIGEYLHKFVLPQDPIKMLLFKKSPLYHWLGTMSKK